MQFTLNLGAGVKQRQDTAGKYFMILDTGAAASVEVWIMKVNDELEYIRTAKRGLRMMTPEGFTHFFLRSAGVAVVEVVASAGRVDIGFADGTAVNSTIVGPIPLPVSNDLGTLAAPMNVVGVTISDAPATLIANDAAVACASVAVVVVAAAANRRSIRFCNLGPDPVALGGAGITWAKRCLVLNIGDVWIEDRAGMLAWSAITDAAKAASVTAQEVLV